MQKNLPAPAEILYLTLRSDEVQRALETITIYVGT